MGTYRRELWFCKSGETGVDGGLQEQIKFLRGEKRQSSKEGKTFQLLFGKRIIQKILFRRLWEA